MEFPVISSESVAAAMGLLWILFCMSRLLPWGLTAPRLRRSFIVHNTLGLEGCGQVVSGAVELMHCSDGVKPSTRVRERLWHTAA